MLRAFDCILSTTFTEAPVADAASGPSRYWSRSSGFGAAGGRKLYLRALVS